MYGSPYRFKKKSLFVLHCFAKLLLTSLLKIKLVNLAGRQIILITSSLRILQLIIVLVTLWNIRKYSVSIIAYAFQVYRSFHIYLASQQLNGVREINNNGKHQYTISRHNAAGNSNSQPTFTMLGLHFGKFYRFVFCHSHCVLNLIMFYQCAYSDYYNLFYVFEVFFR